MVECVAIALEMHSSVLGLDFGGLVTGTHPLGSSQITEKKIAAVLLVLSTYEFALVDCYCPSALERPT
jgi:hypothetical protein